MTRFLPRARRVLACFAVFLVATAPPARAGDAEMARFLLTGAKADVAAKKYDAALAKLARAEAEDPALVEVAYWQGVAHDKRDDVPAARAAYRRFVAAAAAKGRAGKASKDETALAKKAQERIDAIAPGDAERRRIDDEFVGEALALARAHAAKDRLTATEALLAVLDVRPDHAEATKLLQKLGVTPSVAAPARATAPVVPDASGDFRRVKAWEDLLRPAVFELAPGWSQDDARVVTLSDSDAGHLRRPRSDSPTGTSYAIDVECRVLDVLGSRGVVGFGFAHRANPEANLYALETTGTTVTLVHFLGNRARDVWRSEAMDPSPGGWRALGVVVTDKRIAVIVDGKRVAEHEEKERPDLAGEPGLWVQGCRGQIRKFRTGALP